MASTLRCSSSSASRWSVSSTSAPSAAATSPARPQPLPSSSTDWPAPTSKAAGDAAAKRTSRFARKRLASHTREAVHASAKIGASSALRSVSGQRVAAPRNFDLLAHAAVVVNGPLLRLAICIGSSRDDAQLHVCL